MSRRAKTIATSQFAAALMAGTIIAGLPSAAMAQDNRPSAQPEPAPAPAPAPAEDLVIKTTAVAGAQRLEPSTILFFFDLGPCFI
jgi:outer membrane protein insertion porin family